MRTVDLATFEADFGRLVEEAAMGNAFLVSVGRRAVVAVLPPSPEEREENAEPGPTDRQNPA